MTAPDSQLQLQLSAEDEAKLAGDAGPAVAFAMRIVSGAARAMGARELVSVSQAHLTSCFYTGRASIDFAQRMVDLGAQVAVPTTTNAATLAGCLAHAGRRELLTPEHRESPVTDAGAQLMDLYERIGARTTFTCAPYQLATRPKLGQDIAWAESNAVIFANSVLGARTNKYGEFIDVAAAISGRAPRIGMHVPEERLARAVFTLRDLPDEVLDSDVLYHALGLVIGLRTNGLVPAIVGLPEGVGEDRLRALGAIASMPGNTILFHAVGSTPEAPTLADALGGGRPELEVDVTIDDLRDAIGQLTTATDGPLAAVAIGTPHLSLEEFARLRELLAGRRVADGVTMLVSTGRHVREALGGERLDEELADAGITLVLDSCTYIPGILDGRGGVAMTSSAKWAHRGPDTVGMQVLLGSVEECVASAVEGRIVRSPQSWWGSPTDG